MIRRAKRADITKINSLLQSYGLATIDQSYINHRDLCLVAEEGSEIVGFVWAGLMRQNKTAYLDYFTVSREQSKKGVGAALAKEMLLLFKKVGVERAFGVIQQDEFHDKSAFNALRMGMYAMERPFTYVYGSVPHSTRELALGEK
jgi:N-acetylglutamate synthase-like GNAT family acetyltransferase